MEINKIPLFEKGKILDKEMLDEVKNIGLNYIETLYANLDDGVIYGVTPYIGDNNRVIISSGLIKYKKNLLKVNSNLIIDIPIEDGEYICILKVDNIKNTDKFIEIVFSFNLLKNMDIKDDDFEIFRIIRREGASLKEPIIFQGLSKEYNTINIINLKVSTSSGGNLSLKLLKLYAKDMISSKILNEFEKFICFSILNSNCEREFLLNYLQIEDTSKNIDIYNTLEKIYLNSKNKNNNKKIDNIKKNKMMVD